jgi:hypothetical protein
VQGKARDKAAWRAAEPIVSISPGGPAVRCHLPFDGLLSISFDFCELVCGWSASFAHLEGNSLGGADIHARTAGEVARLKVVVEFGEAGGGRAQPAAKHPAATGKREPFVELTQSGREMAAAAGDVVYEIVLFRHRCLRLGPGFEPERVRQLLQLLEESC